METLHRTTVINRCNHKSVGQITPATFSLVTSKFDEPCAKFVLVCLLNIRRFVHKKTHKGTYLGRINKAAKCCTEIATAR